MRKRVLVLAVTAAAAVTALSGPAGAGGSKQFVTITSTEPLCCPAASTFVASGGIFGARTTGSFHVDFTQKPHGQSGITLVRGTDTLTWVGGSVAWEFVARCRAATTFPGLECDGSWHVVSDGASGGGTLHGALNFATFMGSDTFTGHIVGH